VLQNQTLVRGSEDEMKWKRKRIVDILFALWRGNAGVAACRDVCDSLLQGFIRKRIQHLGAHRGISASVERQPLKLPLTMAILLHIMSALLPILPRSGHQHAFIA